MKHGINILFYLVLGLHCFGTVSWAQVRHGDTLEFIEVNDSAYGINIYEPLNMVLVGDSIRNDARGYAVQGWMEDYYPNKQVLHKGYYIDGQLKAYKNYYPNGQLEREFRMTDLNKSTMSVYYQDGKLKVNAVYSGSAVIKEEDYYASGQLEFVEEYDRKGDYYLQRKFYNPNGKPTSLLEITDQKKKYYSSKEYYDNGNIKEEGQVLYNESIGDYQKNGKWKFYDESGKLKEEKIFSKGEETE